MAARRECEGCTTHGPWGGSEGNKWVYMPKGFLKKVKIIVGLEYRDALRSICFQTNNSKGEPQSSIFGAIGGVQTKTFCIDYPYEYLMSIRGTVGDIYGSVRLTSICFMTNLNLYGPYGNNNGTVFSYDVTDGVVVGFHGLVSPTLTAIGVYVMPDALASGPNSAFIMPESCSSLPIMAMPREAGPWGAGGGKPWDDGVFSTVKQVRVYLGELNVIYALQFNYRKKDGNSVLSQLHGGTDASKIELVDLDVEEEFLTGISGFFGPIKGHNGLEAIQSISFHTNKRTHGPYGERKGAVYYSSTLSPGKIVGFQGRDNGFLSAIGVHMEYF